MKILLAVPEYPPYNVGGGGEVFKNLTDNFSKLGHEVVVIYGYHPAKSLYEKIVEYENSGIKFYQIPEIPTPKKYPFLKTVMPPNMNSWLGLKKIIKEERPDVAYLHGYGFVLINIIANICHSLKIKYIYTLHGAPVSPNKMGGMIDFLYKIYRFLYGEKTLKNAYKITAVSKYTTTFKEFSDYKNIAIINNGINLEDYEIARKKSTILERDSNEAVFASLGRIEWLKGFQFFVKIMPELLKNGYNVRYKIAGKDNGFKKELDKLINELDLKDMVEFVGQLDFQEVNFILNSDYVLVTSLIENYPAVPIEAIVLGKAVIGNNIGGIPEIIKDGENGYLVDAEKSNEFYSQVTSILENNNLNKINNLQEYSWKAKTIKYLELLTQ